MFAYGLARLTVTEPGCATGRMESPAKMRQVRREIARIKTLLNEKARA